MIDNGREDYLEKKKKGQVDDGKFMVLCTQPRRRPARNVFVFYIFDIVFFCFIPGRSSWCSARSRGAEPPTLKYKTRELAI